MIDWLLRPLGFGRVQLKTTGPPKSGVASRDLAARSAVPPARMLTPEQFHLNRRLVIAYVAPARIPIRQALATRQIWLADLGNVYEAIRTRPTALILEQAGEVGLKHEPAFRHALALAQSLEPPPACESVHAALVGWLTCLDAACLALMDARRLGDRSRLGTFRDHLSSARRFAASLASERAQLLVDYRLSPRPSEMLRPRSATAPEAAMPPAARSDRPAGTRTGSTPRLSHDRHRGARPGLSARRPDPNPTAP